MKVITLLNEKGGVCKTTLSTTIASKLAITGYKVLLIDADAQGHSTIAFGLPKEPGFYDLLVRNASYQDTLRQVPADAYAPDGITAGSLLLVPSNIETRNIASSISDGFLLSNRLAELRDIFDYVVIDTSPTPSLLHTSIYMATDFVVYPTKLERWSLDGLVESMQHLESVNQHLVTRGIREAVAVAGIVPTITELGTVEHAENYKALRDAYGDLVLRPIAKRTVWREAASFGKSIFAYALDDDRSVKSANQLVSTLLERVA